MDHMNFNRNGRTQPGGVLSMATKISGFTQYYDKISKMLNSGIVIQV